MFEPFYVVPTRFSATFVPRFPFAGQYGPLLYDDPWWKLALAILALILALLGALEESGQSAYEDEDFVIGTLFDSVRHQLDAALCLIDTSRDLSFLTVLDAQSDEANQTPVMALDGNVTGIQANVMSQEEVEALLLEAANSGDTSVLRVFKSGARTGLTFAEIAGFDPPWIRCDEDDVPLAQCPANRQTRFDDEDRPTLSFRPVATGSPAAPSEGLPAGIGVGRLACVAFGHFSPNTVFPSPHQFGGVAIADNRDVNLQIVGWSDNEPNSLYFAREGLTVTHAPANRGVLRVGQYTGEHVTVQACNTSGDLVDQVVKSTPNQAEVLQLAGEGIVRVTITGGGNEGILVQYCYDPEGQGPPAHDWMRCFRGSMDLPQDAPIGRWIVFLAVQNINHVPGGVAPEIAATVIGGHVMGPSAQVLGCGFMLLGDHAFDIF